MMFFVTLVRHAETTANRNNIIQGQSDTDLSNFGLEQAQLVANRLKNERFTHVYTSDLTRAAGTAQTIVDTNKVCKCPLIKDKRLRERKFGVVEGKTYREFALEARKENISLPAFTPRGGEKVEQLRERAKLFFQDLCDQLLSSNGNTLETSTQFTKRHIDSELNHTGSMKSVKNTLHNNDDDDEEKLSNQAKRPRHNDMDDDSDNELYSQEVFIKDEPLTNGRGSVTNGNSEHHHEYATVRDVFNKDPPVTDGEIKMSITCPKYTSTGCPNVSLSPLLEKRFSSISSASSGRNNSFDESDNQQCIADILIVSHGGFLKEFIRHFIEDLHCKIPGGKCYALRVGPNTSMSKFTVSFENGCDKPVVTCLLIHDKDHLRNLDIQAPDLGI